MNESFISAERDNPFHYPPQSSSLQPLQEAVGPMRFLRLFSNPPPALPDFTSHVGLCLLDPLFAVFWRFPPTTNTACLDDRLGSYLKYPLPNPCRPPPPTPAPTPPHPLPCPFLSWTSLVKVTAGNSKVTFEEAVGAVVTPCLLLFGLGPLTFWCFLAFFRPFPFSPPPLLPPSPPAPLPLPQTLDFAADMHQRYRRVYRALCPSAAEAGGVALKLRVSDPMDPPSLSSGHHRERYDFKGRYRLQGSLTSFFERTNLPEKTD